MTILKKDDYLELAKIFKENFKVVSESPYSTSIYNSNDIDWNYKPEGSYRIADHWNFDGHCKTHQEVKNNTHLSVGIYRDGKYDIIGSYEIQSKWTLDSKMYKGIDYYRHEEVESSELKVKRNFVKTESFMRFCYEVGDRKDNPTFHFMIVDDITISLDNPDLEAVLDKYPSDKVKKIINNKRTTHVTKVSKLKGIADSFEVYKDYKYQEVK